MGRPYGVAPGHGDGSKFSTDIPKRYPGKSCRVGRETGEGQNNPAPTPLKDKRMSTNNPRKSRNGGPK